MGQVKLALSVEPILEKRDKRERVHHCTECGYTTDRDVAAAQVVAQRGLLFVADGQSVILPAEEGFLGTPMKQEKPSVRKGSPRSTR